MFLSWLFSIFPRELAFSWRLLRRDLPLWIALATLLSLATIGIAQYTAVPEGEVAQPPLFLAIIRFLSALVMSTLPPVLFSAAARDETLDWVAVGQRIAGRVLPLFLYFAIAGLLALAASSLVFIASAQLLEGTPVAPAASGTLSSIILISILCTFAFLPYFVLLSDREQTPGALWETPRVAEFGHLFWPLIASARSTEGLRWSLAPYVVLNFVAPRLAPLVPTNVLLPAMVVGLLVSLIALAVTFDYWLLTMQRKDALDFEITWPDKGFGKR